MSKIIVTGNPVDGFEFFGPIEGPDFEDFDRLFQGDDWWAAELSPIPSGEDTKFSPDLEWLRTCLEEMEELGVELPMGDYGVAYDIIDKAVES